MTDKQELPLKPPSLCLTPEFIYRVACGPVQTVGHGPFGKRQYYSLHDGVVTGARLSGRLLGEGADWMLFSDDGYMHMDVRIQIRTDDGANILAHYFGPAQANAKLLDAVRSITETSFEDQAIRTHWVLESGAPQYEWVNRCVFVGEGRVKPRQLGVPGFEHRIYRVG